MLKNRLQNLSNRAVLGILLFLFVGGSLWSLVINLNSSHANFADWGESWLQNFSTEMFGAFITFILLQLVVGGRQQREAELKAEQHHKKQLMIQIRSKDNAIALQGLEELRADGWIEDGSLQGANLVEANLQNADLKGASLQGANLVGANLQNADLKGASLQGADLMGANPEGADLMGANLEGANLLDVNLQGADLTGAKFDETTILPDDTHWTTDTKMTRFTQPDNEDG